MSRFILLFAVLYSCTVGVYAQGTLIGKIVFMENGKEEPLYGANVWWESTEEGTTTLEDGTFEIRYVKGGEILNISFVGFKRIQQPIEGRPERIPPIVMEAGDLLDEVEIREVIKATELNTRSVSLTYEINKKELRKAACCNVAESFETNPAVDISYSDAITGTKRIEMLGLSGKYSPVQIENIPFGRGLATVTGLTFIPGPWVENIHVSKGTGTVVNGFESTTGLIDVELTSPEDEEHTHINAYLNSGGRNELNLVNVKKHGSKWASAHLLHGSNVPIRWDVNNNGFIDMPLSKQLNGISRWKYKSDHWRFQVGTHYIYNQNRGGQTDYNFDQEPQDNDQLWGMEIENQRLSVFTKTAYLFEGDRESSLGFIANGFSHRQDAFFGSKELEGVHDGAYFNLIYQNGAVSATGDCKDGDHWIFKTGMSLQYDYVTTSIMDYTFIRQQNMVDVFREEAVTGIYGETQWKPGNKFDAVLGLRGDYSTVFGVFTTPRLHLRYAPQENLIFRAHAGSSRRSPLPIQENLNVLGSNRYFNSQTNLEYGMLNPRFAGNLPSNFSSGFYQNIEQEIAWNFGLSIQREFRLFYRKGSVVIDGFYTHFDNQLVVDMDYHPQMLRLYYGQGGFSRGAMIQFDYEVWKRLEVRLAYKYLDVQQPFEESGLRETQLLSPHRAFVNLEYETRNKWGFDLTVNWFSSQRLPDTHLSPTPLQLAERSPYFFLVNTQVRKDVNNKLTLFLGVENLLNFRQQNPIVNSDNPTMNYFDASMVWGPIFGRMAYLRMDYTF